MTPGVLYVIEGPDGVGKSTIASAFANYLRVAGQTTRLLAFPGREEGTLGRLVWALHHEPTRYGVHNVAETSLQLMHVASHIDALETTIRPALARGEVVVLDRFWWSTIVYGRRRGVPAASLDTMIQLERFHWEGNSPTLIFVIDRDQPFRLESQPEVYQELRRGYRMLAEHAENAVVIDNSGTVRSAVHEIVATIEVESYKV